MEIEKIEDKIARIESYINQRITQAEEYIAVEKLAGNEPKELAEKSAQAELYGVLKFIDELDT